MTREEKMTKAIREYDLKTLLDAEPVIVTVIDPRSYTALYQNATGEQKLGAITGKLCYQCIPKLDNVCPFCKMEGAIKSGSIESSEVQMPDGTWLLVQFAPIRKEDGNMDIVETITDITKQKTQDQEHEKTVSILVERTETIEKLRSQVKSLGADPVA
jgi:hypothetical protein